MKIAFWIIAICEIVRLAQNSLQLYMMKHNNNDKYMDRATNALIQSFNRTDKEFLEQLKAGGKNDD